MRNSGVNCILHPEILKPSKSWIFLPCNSNDYCTPTDHRKCVGASVNYTKPSAGMNEISHSRYFFINAKAKRKSSIERILTSIRSLHLFCFFVYCYSLLAAPTRNVASIHQLASALLPCRTEFVFWLNI